MQKSKNGYRWIYIIVPAIIAAGGLLIESHALRYLFAAIVLSIGIAIWIWFFVNSARPRFNKPRLFVETNIFVIIICGILWTAVGVWLHPVPNSIPLIGLTGGIILGFWMSQ